MSHSVPLGSRRVQSSVLTRFDSDRDRRRRADRGANYATGHARRRLRNTVSGRAPGFAGRPGSARSWTDGSPIRSARAWRRCPGSATPTSTPSRPGWSTRRHRVSPARCAPCPSELGEEDWPDRILHGLAGLHLLSRAHASLETLPDDLAATVRSRIGYPVAKADVLAGPGLLDSWWAVGAVDVADLHLRRRRVWLRGAATGRWAVWLTFAPTGACRSMIRFSPGRRSPVSCTSTRARDSTGRCSGVRPTSRSSTSTCAGARSQTCGGSSPDWSRPTPGPPGCRRRCSDDPYSEDGQWWLQDTTGAGCPLLRTGGPTVAAAGAVGR